LEEVGGLVELAAGHGEDFGFVEGVSHGGFGGWVVVEW
jgi:hypothetical protein